MMWVLDTDVLTLLQRGGSDALPLQMRLGQVPDSDIVTTIVNYEEQMRGWLAQAARADTPEKTIDAYASLLSHFTTLSEFLLLPFDAAASLHFENLRKARVSIGTKDLRIAAICLAWGATLLTRNLKDFGRVPGLRAEDWSA